MRAWFSKRRAKRRHRETAHECGIFQRCRWIRPGNAAQPGKILPGKFGRREAPRRRRVKIAAGFAGAGRICLAPSADPAGSRARHGLAMSPMA